MINAIIIDEKDDVVVAIEPIKKDSEVNYSKKDGSLEKFKAIDDITIYHKIAAKKISKGKPINKYGEHIGIASVDIEVGMHVHEHNVESVRENL